MAEEESARSTDTVMTASAYISPRDIYSHYLEYTGPAMKFLDDLCQSRDISFNPNNHLSLHNKLQRIITKCKKLKQNKKLGDKYWDEQIQITLSDRIPQLPSLDQWNEQFRTNKELKRKVVKLEKTVGELAQAESDAAIHMEAKLEVMADCSKRLEKALAESSSNVVNEVSARLKVSATLQSVTDDFNTAKQGLTQAQEKIISLNSQIKQANAKNLKRKISRRDTTIAQLAATSKEQLSNLALCEQKLAQTLTNYDSLKVEKTKLYKSLHYTRSKLTKAVHVPHVALAEEIAQLKEKIETLEVENRELDQLGSLLHDEEIVTFQGGKYTDAVRQTVMELLQQNVAMAKIGPVIKTVISNLTSKHTSRLPSKALASQILREANFLAKSQVAQEMLGKTDQTSGHCLHSDGTTKFHKKYYSYQVTTVSGKQFTIGMKEMAGGDTAAVMDSFRSTIEDISATLVHEDNEKSFSELVCSLKNTMSDQGAVNPVFNSQLEALRTELLPDVIEKWDELTKEKQESLSHMSHFFCKMHLLVNMAGECDKVLKEFENIAAKNHTSVHAMPLASESGAARVVRTAVKALHHKGCEMSGAASDFSAFLSDRDKVMKLVQYRGNRFNILFYDAAAAYYHLDDIKVFLDSLTGKNRLLQAVEEDLKCTGFLAGMRALGILDKLVTGPFWRRMNEKETVLDLNDDLLLMSESFQKWSENASPLLDGSAKMFANQTITKDAIFDALFTPNPILDALTQTALEMLMFALLLILERQAQDQLPGGKHVHPSSELKESASNVPTTNIISERDFGGLDLLMRMKPSASTLAIESIIMWSNNKTSEWLRSLSTVEKEKMMTDARQGGRLMQKRFKERSEQIKTDKLRLLLTKQAAKEEKETKLFNKKVYATNALTGEKPCMSLRDVDNLRLSTQDEAALLKKLHAQLAFHQHVLCTKAERRLFAKSTGGRNFSCEELLQHLRDVIAVIAVPGQRVSSADTDAEAEDSEFKSLKSKLVQRRQAAKIKRSIDKEKNKLELYKAEPNLLVGKLVEHNCNTEGGEEWFKAIVGTPKLNSSDVLKTQYELTYCEYPDDKYSFNLLRDLQKGDLIIYD